MIPEKELAAPHEEEREFLEEERTRYKEEILNTAFCEDDNTKDPEEIYNNITPEFGVIFYRSLPYIDTNKIDIEEEDHEFGE